MRLERFAIRNYKGIARAEIDDLSRLSVVTISGRNGTGKSLLLEAVVGAWSGRYDMTQRVGPWADQLSIDLTLHLADDEWAAVDAWHERFHGGSPAPRDVELQLVTTATRPGGTATPVMGTVIGILRNAAFQRENPFSVIDFLPANRLVPSAPTPSVDLGMLNVERVEQERFQMLDQFINQRSPISLPSVANYLITLDYQQFLADRQGLDVENDYSILATAFHSSTGKTLRLPAYDPSRGSNIEIELPAGHLHGLADLSSGEQEMLAMMYFVRRLSAAGGILCIDEPEQHLHPSLQAALFDSMRDMAERSQVLVVSHSANLIAASPLDGLVELRSPSDDTNQAQRVRDVPGRVELIADLGITAADLSQSDLVIVVEGDTDAQWLRALFPVELGRAHVLIAGSSGQVLDAHSTLEKSPIDLPWICIRDRDLLDQDEIEALEARYAHLHVWPRRAIESLLLDPQLVSGLLAAVGQERSAAEVAVWLAEASQPLQERVLEELVRHELSRRFPPPTVSSDGDRYARIEQEMRDYARVNEDRANAVQEAAESLRQQLAQRWSRDWAELVDPKPMMELLKNEVGVFRTSADLITALVAHARDNAAARPIALEELRVKLVGLTTRAE